MPRVTQNKIIFDAQDWLEALNPQYVTGLTDVPVPRGTSGLASASNINPFRRIGHMIPGALATDVTNVSAVTDSCRNIALGVESSVQYGYVIGQNKLLHRLQISNKTVTNAGAWPHTMNANGEGQDVLAYQSNVGSTSNSLPTILYSYNISGGAWNVGRYIPSTATFQDTYFTATIASAPTPSGATKPHPLVYGDNGIAYVGDGNVLRAIDGTTGADGTASAYPAIVPAGYIITSFAKYTPFLVIYAYYSPQGSTPNVNLESSGPAKAFFWDYLSQNPTYVYDLHDSCVSAGFNYQGTVGCFTGGNKFTQEIGGPNRFSRLQLFDGSRFVNVVDYIGNPPIHGGVSVVGDAIQWNADGAQHSWGSPIPGFKAGHNILTSGEGTTSGLLATIGGDIGYQLISTGATTSGGLQYLATGTFTDGASFSTLEGIPEEQVGQWNEVTSVKIYFSEACSGGRNFAFYLKDERGNTKQIISILETVDSTNIVKEYYQDVSNEPINFPFGALSVIGEWTGGSGSSAAPFIKQVEVTYQPRNIEQ